jgi:spore germination cell wall hydrolase CwlJ-like protein
MFRASGVGRAGRNDLRVNAQHPSRRRPCRGHIGRRLRHPLPRLGVRYPAGDLARTGRPGRPATGHPSPSDADRERTGPGRRRARRVSARRYRAGAGATGAPLGLHAAPRTADSEHECLANAVYFESKGEPLQGQLSVAEVVLNRARSGRFPASICGVVKQRGQFSFVRGGRLPPVPRASAAWKKAVAVARIALEDLADSPARKALFFHATRVKPSWRGLKRVATVGNHIFYR